LSLHPDRDAVPDHDHGIRHADLERLLSLRHVGLLGGLFDLEPPGIDGVHGAGDPRVREPVPEPDQPGMHLPDRLDRHVGACPDSGKACTDVAQVTQTAERTDASTDCSDGTFKIGTPTGGSDLIVTQSDLTGFGGGSLFYYANAGNYAPCPKTWLPASIPFVDSLYGSGTLVYNTTGKWTACLAGLSYPAFGTCTAKTIAIHYELTHDGGLKVHCNATGVCPNTSTCTTASGASNFVVAAPTVTPECAAGAVASYAVPTAAGTFGRSLYRGTAATISITLP
jgi:hypothetical protein